VQKLKFIKRMGYGRAGSPRLRLRVHARQTPYPLCALTICLVMFTRTDRFVISAGFCSSLLWRKAQGNVTHGWFLRIVPLPSPHSQTLSEARDAWHAAFHGLGYEPSDCVRHHSCWSLPVKLHRECVRTKQQIICQDLLSLSGALSNNTRSGWYSLLL